MRTRHGGVVAALSLLTVAAVSRSLPAGAQEAMVFLPPVGASAESTALGMLMHAAAERMLVEGGAPAVVNVRHVLQGAASLEAPPSAWWRGDGPAKLARLFGAKRIVVGRLRAAGTGYTLDLKALAAGVAGAARSQALPAGLAAAIDAAGRAIAREVMPAVKLPPLPAGCPPDRATAHFAACHAALLQQPIVLESPALLRGAELARAVAECGAAIEAAPDYDQARSALGLVLAMSDRASDAAVAIARLPTAGYDPELFLAHYWLATRYRSTDDGLAILREEVRRHPASLLARGYLAEHLLQTGRFEESLAEWGRVHDLASRAALPLSRMSTALARLKRDDEAIALARELAALHPGEASRSLALGARYVDAGRFDEAIATLQPIVDATGGAAALERLGWAWLRKGMVGKARSSFQRSFDVAGRTPAGWRTRGRALGGLIRAAAAAGDAGSTRDWVERAQQEDFVPFLRALRDPAITAALDQAEQARPPDRGAARPGPPRFIPPIEATPLPLDPAGEVDANARSHPSVPSSIELLRF